jgi:amino acid adenylation domain-containing protein
MFEDQQLSYGELDRRSNQLAHYLRRQGVGPDVVVGLCVERSLAMVIGLLGILKAGGAYLPLDPNYPQERLAFMLADSQVPIVVTEEKAVDILPVSWARIVCLDLEWTAIEAEPGEAPESGVEADNLAYMIYTSGSTGTPKGALLQHNGLCNLAAAQIAGFDVQADCRVLQFASLNFDASISEIAMALCAGATLCLTRDILSGDADLAGILTGLDITTVTLPPSVLPLLTGKDLPSLRTLVVAGEACPAEVAAYWASRCRLVNAYGPTEATVCATFGAYADAGTRLSIGRPMRNTRAYVLDEELSPAPIGITGELYVGGVGLARGYLGRPGLTAERFVPNPHGDGERLYRTGDLARWRADGELEFLGRVDHQVKLRGYRIELGEIEAALSRNPAVRQAVVVAREEAEGDRRLVAYVVPQGEETPDVSQLRTHLKQSLPDYMVPAAFIMLEALPLNPSGKVDRLALPAQPNHELSKRHGIAPRNELEVNLVEIWERLLGVAPISVDDDFFELGGNSLLVIQLAHEMNKKNYSISPTSISRYPTIESLARSIETNLAGVSGDCIIQLKSGSPDRPLFLVHPVGGMASCYFELAKCVDLPRAIFGVNAPGLTGDTNIPTSIEAMAEYYIEAIRDMHPLGPYDVGGWSMGGVIAYEMARRLGEGAGERPAVVLIDTYFYSGAEIGEDRSDSEGLWHAFLDNLLLSGGEARPTIGRIHDSLGYRKERNGQDLMLRAREVLAEYSVIGSDVSERYLASMFDSYTTNLKAARRYVPGPYDGPILAITTEQPDRSVQRPGQAAPLQSGPRLERHYVSSDHFSLMRRPAAEMLGTSLTKFLSAHQT